MGGKGKRKKKKRKKRKGKEVKKKKKTTLASPPGSPKRGFPLHPSLESCERRKGELPWPKHTVFPETAPKPCGWAD